MITHSPHADQGITLEDIEDHNEFPNEDRGRLAERRYARVIEQLGEGEGATRNVYRIVRGAGDAAIEEVLKIERPEIDPNESIAAASNHLHKNGNTNEIHIGNRLTTRGVVRPRDSFRLADGRRVSSEDYKPDSISLQQLVEIGIDETRKRRIMRSLVDTIYELHTEDGVVHRDVKPTNIVVTRQGDPLFTDLQTARPISDTPSRGIPTAGGATYSPPERINGFLSGNGTEPQPRDDLYALGGVFYYLLTGEHPSDRKLVTDEEGDSVTIGERTYQVSVMQEGMRVAGNRIQQEDDEQHLKQLKKRMRAKKIPRWQRDLVYRCMTQTDKKFETAEDLRHFYRVKTEGPIGRIRERVAKNAHFIGGGLALGLVTGLLAVAAVWGINKEPNPRLKDVVAEAEYGEFSIGSLYEHYGERSLIDFGQAIEDAMQRLPALEGEHSALQLENIQDLAQETWMDTRMLSSWLRANYLMGQAAESYERDEDPRLFPGFAPAEFARATQVGQHSLSYIPPHSMTDDMKLEVGAQYLKQALGSIEVGSNMRPLNAFITHYSTLEDILSARRRAFGSSSRTMIEDAEGDRVVTYFNVGETDILQSSNGYQSRLPHHQAQLINSAAGLYLITDEDGVIHWDQRPRVIESAGGYPGTIMYNIELPEAYEQ